MNSILPDLLNAGLIERMDGSDERFAKLKDAAATLAEEFKSQPSKLMYAMLAALDPNISMTDPSILLAKEALKAKWETMGGIYTDEPIHLYRSLLLEACNQCAEGMNAVMLWLVVADSLGLYRLGKEELVVGRFLKELGRKAEDLILKGLDYRTHLSKSAQETSIELHDQLQITTDFKAVNRDKLRNRIGAAVGPNYKGNTVSNPNPHWSNQAQHWSYEFTDRMTELLADELELLAEQMQQSQSQFAEQMQALIQIQCKTTQAVSINYERNCRAEQLRLDALWWSEALYSPVLGKSYRELEPVSAALVMALDLLQVVSMPTPASVGHLLAETVQRLPDAGYEIKKPIGAWLEQLRECSFKPDLNFSAIPKNGRLSIRDVFAWAMSDQAWDITQALQRAGIEANHEISLPALARALFRQEQACRLARETS